MRGFSIIELGYYLLKILQLSFESNIISASTLCRPQEKIFSGIEISAVYNLHWQNVRTDPWVRASLRCSKEMYLWSVFSSTMQVTKFEPLRSSATDWCFSRSNKFLLISSLFKLIKNVIYSTFGFYTLRNQKITIHKPNNKNKSSSHTNYLNR